MKALSLAGFAHDVHLDVHLTDVAKYSIAEARTRLPDVNQAEAVSRSKTGGNRCGPCLVPRIERLRGKRVHSVMRPDIPRPIRSERLAWIGGVFPHMAEAEALATAHLSRYDALLRVSKTLAGHKTIAELFQVLADHLHTVVPFDYLALILHEEPTDHIRLVVLEPRDIVVPPAIASQAVAERAPAAIVWETQKGLVIPIPETGPLATRGSSSSVAREEKLRVGCP